MQISVYAKALNETMSESGFEFNPETVAKAVRGNPGVPILTDAESLSNEIIFPITSKQYWYRIKLY